MNRVWKNWTVHNVVAHPLSELVYWIIIPFMGKDKAEDVSGWIHDITIPIHVKGTGRG